MENHTKRIRKARRQGLADGGRALARSPRARISSRTTGSDVPGPKRPNARRDSAVTTRRQKRQGRNAVRSAK